MTMTNKPAALLASILVLSGCALRSDVTRLETQLAAAQAERARADSATAANLAGIARMLQSLYDTLAMQSDALTRLRGDMRVELFNVEQQLVAIQELTGQSQQRLSELRANMDDRFQALLTAPQNAAPGAAPGAPAAPAAGQPNAPAAGQPSGNAPATNAPAATPPASAPAAAPATPPGANPAAGSEPSPDQLLNLSLAQLRRGSPSTARIGLAEFLRRYPNHARAADAEYFMGEAFAAEQSRDSANASYQRVVQRYPNSPRAAAAMYKLGLLAAQANRREDARTWFNRVVSTFPNSEEAPLAREQLRTLGAPPANPPATPPRRPPAA
jgi:tol-pal system protein YbgF